MVSLEVNIHNALCIFIRVLYKSIFRYDQIRHLRVSNIIKAIRNHGRLFSSVPYLEDVPMFVDDCLFLLLHVTYHFMKLIQLLWQRLPLQ